MQHFIASYLFQNKTCPLPGLGTLSIINSAAQLDFTNKLIASPKTNIQFQQTESDATGLVNYIAASTGSNNYEVTEAMDHFCDDLKNKVTKESGATLDQIGNLVVDGSGKLNFKQAELPTAFFQSVIAERVIHPQAEHQILVGDKETTNTVMTEFLTEKYPTEAAQGLGGDAETLTWLTEQLALVDWPAGDPDRGRKLFEKRSCAQCHGGRQGLGPDLAGATSRFSRNDVFVAIALPNRDVSTRYQTTLIETKQGKVHTGLIVYESADGVLLRNTTNQTLRIETRDIETRRTLPQSLMPSGLLKEFRSTDFADLFAYLKSLSSTPIPATTAK